MRGKNSFCQHTLTHKSPSCLSIDKLDLSFALQRSLRKLVEMVSFCKNELNLLSFFLFFLYGGYTSQPHLAEKFLSNKFLGPPSRFRQCPKAQQSLRRMPGHKEQSVCSLALWKCCVVKYTYAIQQLLLLHFCVIFCSSFCDSSSGCYLTVL